MALIISTHGNCCIRSEEIASIGRVRNRKTNRFTKTILIILKSGYPLHIDGKTINEAKNFYESIVDILKNQ